MSERQDPPEPQPDSWRPEPRPWGSAIPEAMRRGADLRRAGEGNGR